MARGLNPLSYRLGFFRNWDSLFSESLYVRSYNNFMKSQLINFYLEGFFKRWGWNGRRSYFLNFLYSHTEISWSFNYINLIIYLYNTGSEIAYNKFFYELKKRNIHRLIPFKPKLDLIKYFNVLYFMGYNKKLIYGFNYNKNKGNDNDLLNLKKKLLNSKNFFSSLYLKGNANRKVLFSKSTYMMMANDLKFGNLSYSLTRFLNRLRKKNKLAYKINIKSKELNKKKNENNFKRLMIYKVNSKLRQISSMLFFTFLKKLLSLNIHRTFFNLANFFYFINPLSKILRRHFSKDFFKLLGLNKFSNVSSMLNIKFIKLNSSSVTAAAYAKHIWLKLHKKYNFSKVVYMVLRHSRSNSLLKGVRILIDGRATKKQKAWHKTYVEGKVHLSTQSSFLDYSFLHVKLRYGILSAKLSIGYV
jgi:hypothetical protein